jgi:hypothetical protein
MSEKREIGFDARRDGLGIVLFTAGAFFSVLLAMALGSSEPLERAEGTGTIARIWAGSIGLMPGLLFSAGIAVLGGWLFLVGGGGKLTRHTGGLAFAALGLSVLLGAFSASAGGLVGDLSGGVLARSTHVVIGALFGLAAFAAPVWFFWVRPTLAARSGGEPVLEPERPASRPLEEGVTAAEAAALIPEELPSWRAEPRKQSPSLASAAVLPSPYREDVRRRGEVPEGARPLHPPHVHTPTPFGPSGPSEPLDAPAASSVQHWTPAAELAPPGDSADEDLAGAEEPAPVSEVPEEEEEEDELSEAAGEILVEEPLVEAAEVDVEPAPAARATEHLLRPSWEQSSLFEVEEEPVDAYGTPVSLVDSVGSSDTGDLEAAEEPEEHATTAPTQAEHTEELLDPAEAASSADESRKEEREVLLQPAATPAKKKAKVRSRPEDRAVLLAEIGCLLVERGRVAVSMLQKQYGMDFEEATRVLDELQEMGLIGPYLGGQRRDILLTRDEWLEKVSSR